MAYRYEQGYDERRFEGPVQQDLFCSICQCVLRDPRTCQNREHAFCLFCISQHLCNSHTCPECREVLTPETLKIPRFLNNVLSELKIRCEFIERGCPGYVQLGNLQNHTERCGFAPVIQEHVDEMKARQDEIKARLILFRSFKECIRCSSGRNFKRSIFTHTVFNHACSLSMCTQHHFKPDSNTTSVIQKNVDEMKASQNEMKVTITEMERKQTQIKVSSFEGTSNILVIFYRQSIQIGISHSTSNLITKFNIL